MTTFKTGDTIMLTGPAWYAEHKTSPERGQRYTIVGVDQWGLGEFLFKDDERPWLAWPEPDAEFAAVVIPSTYRILHVNEGVTLNTGLSLADGHALLDHLRKSFPAQRFDLRSDVTA